MAVVHQFVFPPEVQARREPVLSAMRHAMAEGALPAVREAQSLAATWLNEHPEDYTVWDAGEPLAMLEQALSRTGQVPVLTSGG